MTIALGAIAQKRVSGLLLPSHWSERFGTAPEGELLLQEHPYKTVCFFLETQCHIGLTKTKSVSNMNNNEVTNCHFLREDNINGADWISLARITYVDKRTSSW
jgi:hypothetical protein